MTNESLEAPPVREEERPARRGIWRRVGGGLSRFFGRFWGWMQPGPRARRGASWGAALAAALVVGVFGTTLRPGFSLRWDLPAGIVLALLVAVLAGLALLLILKILSLLPRFLGALGLGALAVFLLLAGMLSQGGFPFGLALEICLGFLVVHAALGGALALLFGRPAEGGQPGRRRIRRAALALIVLGALAFDVWLARWIVDRGSHEHLVKVRRPDPVRVAPLAAPDPSQRGPYRVETLTYGSGKDRWRPEFGPKAALKTPPVDGTPFLTGNEGWRMKLRQRFWGFGFDALPRNGRVWQPVGPGPFPLVLVVHGNHDMTDFSDPGYAWLGELLASRGFITVSVDENFLNGGGFGGLDKENDARAWLLLQHLAEWRRWSRTPGNPFHGRVDLARIGLIGHSRGGEAVAVAAAFNRLPRYPDDATIPLGFGFGIRAVVAIAPVDGQYQPAGKPMPLAGFSYLLLQGAHDGDVSAFSGERAFRRLTFEDRARAQQPPGQLPLQLPGTMPAFKAEIYSYRANHGQFNTVWGNADAGWPFSVLLNREALLSGSEQRRLGAVAIAGFLEATLHDEPAYVRLFRDLRSGRGLLPKDLYITRFQDATFRPLVDSEEDVDVATGSVAGAAIEGHDLAEWKQVDLAYRKGDRTKQNQVIYLGWKRDPAAPGKVATWAVRLPAAPPPDWTPPNLETLLVLSLADSGEEPADPKDKAKKDAKESPAQKEKEKAKAKKKAEEREAQEKRDKEEGKEPLDLSIELVAANGRAVRLPLSRFRALPVPLESHFSKLAHEEGLYGKAWEPVLQTFELPLAAFAQADPAFDPAALREVRLVFDRSPEGVVILDDVGFAAGPGGR